MQRGTSLVEVLVSLVLMTIAVLMVYSVIGSSQRLNVDLRSHDAAHLSAQGLSDTLKNYVSADPSALTASGFAPEGSWRLPGDSCAWALDPNCAHQASALLDPAFRAKYPNASMSYVVARLPDGSLSVDFSVRW